MNSQPDMTPRGPDEAASTTRDVAGWERWFTSPKLAVLIGLFLFALYPEVVLGSHSFFYRDFGFFGYPLTHYWRESIWHGEVPLWNPLNNCGLPFLAQWNTMVCYPPSLVCLLLPLPWSLNCFCLAHLLLAGIGMFLLAHRWTGNRFAASAAGLAYALNGLTLHALMWPNNIAALAWMPLVVLWAERAWREGGRCLVWAALMGALQMLAGAPEVILLTWIMLAALWLGQVLCRAVVLRLALLRFALVAALVFGLAAIQLLPFLDLLAHAQLDRTAGKEYWAMPVWGWANLLVPLFHCSPSILGVYSQTDQQWTSSYYLGLGALTLAMLAIRRVRNGRVALLIGFALAGLILALGENGLVYGWLKRAFPMAGFVRYPIKFVVFTVFALPVLAAFGLDWFQRGSRDGNALRRSLVLAALALALLIGGIVGWAYRFPLPDDSWHATWQSGVTRIVLLALLVAALLRFTLVPSARRRVWMGFVVLALAGLDAVTHTPRQNPTVPSRAYGPLELNLPSRPKLGESRAMLSHSMQLFLGNAATPVPLEYYTGARRSLYANCNLIDRVPKVNGFYSLYLKEEAEVRGLLYSADKVFPEPLADFLGVATITSPTNFFDWAARETSMPLVTAGQRPIFAGPQATLERLASPEFDPRREVFLSPDAKPFVSTTITATAQVVSSNFTAHRIELIIQAEAPTMVVAAQSYYHPWRATVDGQPVRLWRANHAFQALEIPAGRHEVKLVYQDWWFYLGVVISLTTLAGCAFAWFHKRREAAT